MFEKSFFLQFLVDILPLGFGSVEPHIFAALDPGSQNLADPTAPDPKHWKGQTTNFIFDIFICRNCFYVRVLRFEGWFDQFTCSYLPSSSSNSPLLSLQGLIINMQISLPLNIILRNAIFFPKLLEICQEANLK